MRSGGITALALKHKKLTCFMMVFVLITGIYSYVMLPRQENPDISSPMAQLYVAYPGATTTEVEKYITEPIEDKLLEVNGYDFSESVSKNGMAAVFLVLKDNVDTEKSWDEMEELMDELSAELPVGTSEIMIETDLTRTPGMVIGLSSQQYDEEALADYADYLKKTLSKVPGVMRFEVQGELEKQFEITMEPLRLNQMGLSANELAQIIRSKNASVPQGAIENNSGRIELSVEKVFNRAKDLEETIILSKDSIENVRLGHLASVRLIDDPYSARYEHNGEKTVFLVGYFEDSLNIVTVGNKVNEQMERLKTNIPPEIRFSTLVFQPKDVEKAINDFMINLMQAIIFVVIVVLLGMGHRNAVVVSTAIPLSIAFVMVVMYVTGIKLENMSISGLIIALGMLVDNAIVVSDAIQHKIDEGMDNHSAAILGTKEVAFSILTSTLTTIFAFMPLLLLDSTLGKFVYGVPFVVTVSLLASYICAVITTPVIAATLFKPTVDKKKGQKNSRVRRLFTGILSKTLGRGRFVYIATLLFIAMSFASASTLTPSLLPKADKQFLQIDLQSEFASDIQKTKELMDQTKEILLAVPELSEYYASVGSNLPKFYMSVLYRSPSPDIAQLAYKFDLTNSTRFRDKEALQAHVQELLKRELVGGTASTMLLDLASIARPIEVKITGSDLERLDQVSNEISEKLQRIPGAINVEDNFSSQEYQFKVEVDELQAAARGLSVYDIESELSMVLRGDAITYVKRNGNQTPIVFNLDIDSKEKLLNLRIKSPQTGAFVFLKDVVDVSMVSQFPVINHYDGMRSVTVSSDLVKGYSAVDVESELKAFADASDYSDLVFDFEGMMAKVQENNKSLGQLAVFSVFMIFALLVLQFDSFSKPFVVLSAIPIASAAALLGLVVSGQPLSFVAMLSLVSLMGIVVNNAIVLIDAINTFAAEGKTIKEACMMAVERRYRPIMLSTITTVIGLVPLLISGGELFRPLAVALMSGLSLSTLVTLLVVPNLYVSLSTIINRNTLKNEVKES